MNILILGGDGYLGWPTAMYLSNKGHNITIADNCIKRVWEAELGVGPLKKIPEIEARVKLWKEVSGKDIKLELGNLAEYPFVSRIIHDHKPDAVIHYGEQPSAPFSMASVEACVETQMNNLVGTLNLIWAVRDLNRGSHIVKLGSLGEYGTPNIDIEEGFLTVEQGNRSHKFLYPKTPGSFYHLSKVHDSHNLEFACRMWGFKVTDLNQGVVYGLDTDETLMHEDLNTSFHYDSTFGTVLNRFCTQAVCGEPITPYGLGEQKRGFLNIRDTLRCVEIACENPPEEGEFRVFNQFTEIFSVNMLADLVKSCANRKGYKAQVKKIDNPRKESEEHYYNVRNDKLMGLGLKPRLLEETLIEDILDKINAHKDNIDRSSIYPGATWR